MIEYTIEVFLICMLSAHLGLSLHEITHYYIAQKWTDNVSINFWYGIPTIVPLDNPYELTQKQIRRYCAAPFIIWGITFILLLSVRSVPVTEYQIVFFFMLLMAASPSPCDLFGIIYPKAFQEEAEKKLFSNLEAARFIIQNATHRS